MPKILNKFNTQEKLPELIYDIKTKKKWTNPEKTLLWICYHGKIPYKLLTSVLKRTVSALNKKLKRSQIRVRFVSIPKHWRNAIIDLIQTESTTVASVIRGIQTLAPKLVSASPFPISADALLELSTPSSQPRRIIFDEWHSWNDVISFLARERIHVRALTTNEKPHQQLYQMNDATTITAARVLVIANDLRSRKGLPSFHVSGITYVG